MYIFSCIGGVGTEHVTRTGTTLRLHLHGAAARLAATARALARRILRILDAQGLWTLCENFSPFRALVTEIFAKQVFFLLPAPSRAGSVSSLSD